MNGRGTGVGGASAAAAKEIEEELTLLVLLAERVKKAASEADSFKSDCSAVARQADSLSHLLRSAARLAAPYDRPARRVFAESAKALSRALASARRSRRGGLLRRLAAAVAARSSDLRKVQALLDASLGDLQWLLSVYSPDEPIALTMPPIASTDPILAWVWSYIATVQMSPSPSDRAEAASSLSNLASDNDRNKKMIIDEGGVPPLLSLLRDSPSLDARIAATAALSNLASSPDNVSSILESLAVPVLVSVLSDSPMKLQIHVAGLVSRMAAQAAIAQEEFARENAIRPLVSLLSFQVPLDDQKPRPPPKRHTSIHSIVQGINAPSPPGSPYHDGGARRGSHWDFSHHRKEKENESPEVKLQLKIACADALWILSRGCVSNSRKITDTKGLLCLSKIIETEKGELQYNCLMTLMEIAAAAEFDADLRRSTFKTNSPAAKSVVDQFLRLVQEGGSPGLQIAAIKSIGSLARTFPARETRILSPLVVQLGHWNPDVAAEAANALGKFACPENFLCVEHSKAIIEFRAVPQLLRLLPSGEKTQLPALTLLCYLVLHVPMSEALEQAKVLGTLESAARTMVAHQSPIRELLPNAIYHLEPYRVGTHSHGHLYSH